MPDVFEVLGAAHREVEQMLDRMQVMMSVPAELRDQGGALADTLISAVSQHEAAEERTSGRRSRRKSPMGTRSPRRVSSRRPKARRCSPSWTDGPRRRAVRSADD
jgi:hypothetical protein